MKNSSRFELKIDRNLTRSNSGLVGSSASSSTRALNSSQLNSRLMKCSGRKVVGSGTMVNFTTHRESRSETINGRFDGKYGGDYPMAGAVLYRPIVKIR